MPNDDAARGDGGDGDGDATAADAPEETYSARKITLVLALIILISQFQLAFCTKYEYTYEVEHIHEGGDGDTYAYNIWHGIVQLYEDGGEERGERAPRRRHPHERRIVGRAAPALRRVRRVAAAPTSPPPVSRRRLRLRLLAPTPAALLAFVVFLWSGVFPYAKLYIIERTAARVRRGQAPPSGIQWLTAAGKWSFLDIWVVAITVLAVRTYGY